MLTCATASPSLAVTHNQCRHCRASAEIPPLPGRTQSGGLNPTGSASARPTEDWPSDASDISSANDEVPSRLCWPAQC